MDLREAAFTGNMPAVRKFIEEDGIPINEQYKVNGWTALHWAAKGKSAAAVRYLLMHGADKTIKTHKGETAADVTTDATIRELLGAAGPVSELPTKAKFGFELSETATAPMEDVSSKYVQTLSNEEKQKIKDQTAAFQLGELGSGSSSSAAPVPTPVAAQTAPVAAANSSGALRLRVKRKGEEDFFEVDVAQPSYDLLVQSITTELEIDTQSEKVTKIRKLPNTLVRKDADVQRLAVDQELEVEVGPAN